MCIGGPWSRGVAVRNAVLRIYWWPARVSAPSAREVPRARQGGRGGNAMKHALGGLALAFATMSAPVAQAQTYPDRPIKLLVPLAAASAVDVVARVVGEK